MKSRNSEGNGETTTKIMKKVELDDILVEEIGQFGRYQVRTIFLTAAVAVFTAWTNSYMFTAARINTRCFIPGCDLETEEPEFSPSWILHAVPGASDGSFDSCRRFNSTSALAGDADDSCPSMLFNNQSLLLCERYVYETSNTVVYDFDLGCNEWKRSLIGSMRTLGVLVGYPLGGYVSDRWGRRTALAITSFSSACIGLLRLSARNYLSFITAEFAESALGSSYTCAYILLMEMVGPKYRKVIAAAMNTFFSLGLAAMGLLAWGLQNWKHLTLTLYVPQVFTVAYFWIVCESVRWYMSKGRYDEAEAVLNEVARVNKKTVSQKSLIALRSTAEEEKNRRLEKNTTEPLLIIQVFQHTPVLIRCLTLPIWWITTVLIYYGLSINAVNLSGNSYLNFVAVSLIEIPGCWSAVLLMDKIGRRPVLITSFWICAACQIAYIFMPEGFMWVSLTVYLVGKFSIASVMSAVYTYTAELFPTSHRHSLFAFCSMMGRIGSIVAPLTPALATSIWQEFPFALFGGLSLVSGVLVFITPETLGTKFPDTMKEAAEIGRKKL